jgi:hypothetical protein
MEGADGLCPKCGSASVEFDVVAGVSACEACGTVLAELDLVQSAAFDEQGAPVGLFVAGGDTGAPRGGPLWPLRVHAGGCRSSRRGMPWPGTLLQISAPSSITL